jgi:recombination DNA repair RAD52 pathway protein
MSNETDGYSEIDYSDEEAAKGRFSKAKSQEHTSDLPPKIDPDVHRSLTMSNARLSSKLSGSVNKAEDVDTFREDIDEDKISPGTHVGKFSDLRSVRGQTEGVHTLFGSHTLYETSKGEVGGSHVSFTSDKNDTTVNVSYKYNRDGRVGYNVFQTPTDIDNPQTTPDEDMQEELGFWGVDTRAVPSKEILEKGSVDDDGFRYVAEEGELDTDHAVRLLDRLNSISNEYKEEEKYNK